MPARSGKARPGSASDEVDPKTVERLAAILCAVQEIAPRLLSAAQTARWWEEIGENRPF